MAARAPTTNQNPAKSTRIHRLPTFNQHRCNTNANLHATTLSSPTLHIYKLHLKGSFSKPNITASHFSTNAIHRSKCWRRSEASSGTHDRTRQVRLETPQQAQHLQKAIDTGKASIKLHIKTVIALAAPPALPPLQAHTRHRTHHRHKPHHQHHGSYAAIEANGNVLHSTADNPQESGSGGWDRDSGTKRGKRDLGKGASKRRRLREHIKKLGEQRILNQSQWETSQHIHGSSSQGMRRVQHKSKKEKQLAVQKKAEAEDAQKKPQDT